MLPEPIEPITNFNKSRAGTDRNRSGTGNLDRFRSGGTTCPPGTVPGTPSGTERGFRGAILLICAVLAVACAPDRRHTLLVVDSPDLVPAAREGVRFWETATCLDSYFELVTECEGTCVRIKWGELTPPAQGLTRRYPDGSAEIMIAPEIHADDLPIAVTHELGHALGLDHVPKGQHEIMSPSLEHPACAGPATRAEYESQYGDNGCWSYECEP